MGTKIRSAFSAVQLQRWVQKLRFRTWGVPETGSFLHEARSCLGSETGRLDSETSQRANPAHNCYVSAQWNEEFSPAATSPDLWEWYGMVSSFKEWSRSPTVDAKTDMEPGIHCVLYCYQVAICIDQKMMH